MFKARTIDDRARWDGRSNDFVGFVESKMKGGRWETLSSERGGRERKVKGMGGVIRSFQDPSSKFNSPIFVLTRSVHFHHFVLVHPSQHIDSFVPP